jgi:hypothetical protein
MAHCFAISRPSVGDAVAGLASAIYRQCTASLMDPTSFSESATAVSDLALAATLDIASGHQNRWLGGAVKSDARLVVAVDVALGAAASTRRMPDTLACSAEFSLHMCPRVERTIREEQARDGSRRRALAICRQVRFFRILRYSRERSCAQMQPTCNRLRDLSDHDMHAYHRYPPVCSLPTGMHARYMVQPEAMTRPVVEEASSDIG